MLFLEDALPAACPASPKHAPSRRYRQRGPPKYGGYRNVGIQNQRWHVQLRWHIQNSNTEDSTHSRYLLPDRPLFPCELHNSQSIGCWISIPPPTGILHAASVFDDS